MIVFLFDKDRIKALLRINEQRLLFVLTKHLNYN